MSRHHMTMMCMLVLASVGCGASQQGPSAPERQQSCAQTAASLEGRWTQHLGVGYNLFMSRRPPKDFRDGCGQTTMTLAADGTVTMGIYAQDPPPPCGYEAPPPREFSCVHRSTTSGTWTRDADDLVLVVKGLIVNDPVCGSSPQTGRYSDTREDTLRYAIVMLEPETLIVKLKR